VETAGSDKPKPGS